MLALPKRKYSRSNSSLALPKSRIEAPTIRNSLVGDGSLSSYDTVPLSSRLPSAVVTQGPFQSKRPSYKKVLQKTTSMKGYGPDKRRMINQALKERLAS